MTFFITNSGWEWLILGMIFFGIIVPVVLFIIGLRLLNKNKKKGQLILIIATAYSIISFGMCSGF